jgi:hypothetical protein
MGNEIIYTGPICPTCIGRLYKIVVLGGNQWKRCVECKRMTPVKEADNLQPLDPQPE